MNVPEHFIIELGEHKPETKSDGKQQKYSSIPTREIVFIGNRKERAQ